MAKRVSNRALWNDVFRQGQEDLLRRIPAKAAKALMTSLILRHGSLELDRLIRACRLNGRPCHLTGNEYRLLEFLLLHLGEVWSRELLMRHVWRREPSSINLIAVHIVSLRKKLGPRILRTIRGQGYTIDAKNKNRWSVVSGRSPNHTSRKAQV